MKIVLLLFLTLQSTVLANELKVFVQDRRPELFRENDIAKGPIAEIVNELFKNTNLKPKYEFIPWSRTLTEAQAKKSFMLIRHSMTDVRRNFLLPIPYGFELRKIHFIKNKDTNVQAKEYKDLKKYSIGLVRKAFHSNRFSGDQTLNKVPVKSEKQLIKLLERKRVDLIIFNNIADFKATAKSIDIDYEKTFEEVEFKETFPNGRYFSIPIGSSASENYSKLNCNMYKMRKNGRIDYYFEKYGLKLLSQTYTDNDSLKQIQDCQK